MSWQIYVFNPEWFRFSFSFCMEDFCSMHYSYEWGNMNTHQLNIYININTSWSCNTIRNIYTYTRTYKTCSYSLFWDIYDTRTFCTRFFLMKPFLRWLWCGFFGFFSFFYTIMRLYATHNIPDLVYSLQR